MFGSVDPDFGPSRSSLFTSSFWDGDREKGRYLAELGMGEFFRIQSSGKEAKDDDLSYNIKNLYNSLNRPVPHIVFCDSPWSFANKVEEYLRLRRYSSVDFPGHRMFYIDTREIYEAMRKELNHALDVVISNHISGTQREIATRVLSDLYRLVVSPTLDQRGVFPTSGIAPINDVFNFMGKILAAMTITRSYGSNAYFSDSRLVFFRIVETLGLLLMNSFFFAPLPDVIFIVRKPIVFEFEGKKSARLDSMRLHNDQGPVYGFRDDYKIYMYKGVRVPAYVVEDPQKISTIEIVREPNVELRRVKLERYGFARFMLDVGASVVDAYRGEVAGLKGAKLYEIVIEGDEMLKMVSVVDCTPEEGAYRTYFLRVPPNMRTAQEAVAWTWGVDPQNYQPIQES